MLSIAFLDHDPSCFLRLIAGQTSTRPRCFQWQTEFCDEFVLVEIVSCHDDTVVSSASPYYGNSRNFVTSRHRRNAAALSMVKNIEPNDLGFNREDKFEFEDPAFFAAQWRTNFIFSIVLLLFLPKHLQSINIVLNGLD